MASLAEHKSGKFIKMILIGDSGAGKTGALTSLVADGYKLRILDMDNNLASLREWVNRDCPDKINNVDFETRRDKFKMTLSGVIVDGQPKAYVDAVKLLNKWGDESIPAKWGEDTIFVLDSLTHFSNAAFEWAKGMNPSAKDPRQWFGAAQDSVEHVLALLTADAFECNVIVISHIDMRELNDGTTKGFVMSIGKALGPVIPSYFSTLVLAERTGSGKNVRRQIKTLPTGLVDLKTPAPWKVEQELPLDTGLATLFKQLKS